MSTQVSLKVLVVDDEPLLVMTTSDILEDLGHRPVTARSGAEALRKLEGETDIDLLITDQAMPGMNGVDLARQAAALRPSLKIILATGYDNLPADLGVTLTRLSKPYFEQELIDAIQRVMRD